MRYQKPIFVSMDQCPMVRAEAEAAMGFGADPIEMLIELEEEMGCSIVEAVRRYRNMVRAQRTVDSN